jgi:hypothetical protein
MNKIGGVIRTLNSWRRLTVNLPFPHRSQIQSFKNLLGNQLPLCSERQHSKTQLLLKKAKWVCSDSHFRRTELCLGDRLPWIQHPKQLFSVYLKNRNLPNHLDHRPLQLAVFLHLIKSKKTKLYSPQASDKLRLLSGLKFTQTCTN